MKEIDISHLVQYAGVRNRPGAKITAVDTNPGKSMKHSVDKRYLTPTTTGSNFADIVLDGTRVYGMYDTGSNVTLMNQRLATQLGISTEPYTGTYKVASGNYCRFVAKAKPVTVQVHDSLTLEVEGIRIIEDSADRM